jgi:hypothetical protein
MLLVSTPLGSLAIAALAVVGLVAWLVRDRRHPGPRLVGRPPTIDRAALEAAEEEVRTGRLPPLPSAPAGSRLHAMTRVEAARVADRRDRRSRTGRG